MIPAVVIHNLPVPTPCAHFWPTFGDLFEKKSHVFFSFSFLTILRPILIFLHPNKSQFLKKRVDFERTSIFGLGQVRLAITV